MTEGLKAIARHSRLEREWRDPPGWRGAFAAVNHTTIGRRFIFTALAFFMVGGILAMLIRAQLATSGNAFLDHEVYNQIFTMHGTVMMFLFAIPMLEGYALYLLPKMLGSRDLAYPRLGAYAYWCYLFGGLILLGSLFVGVAPDSGWFMYTPLSGAVHSPGINADVWLIGVTFAEISAICAGVELVATILTMRAPGMGLDKMPLFAWYVLVTAGMILVGFPPLILGSILLELERAFSWPFYDVALGGDPLLWQHLFWMFGHPEVYIIFLPAAGIVSTMVPVFSQHPMVGYRWIVGSIVLLAVLSFGLWVHHMFAVGIPHLAQVFFSVASMLVAIPTGVQFFSWIATMWRGKPKFSLPMLYLAGFFFVFICGGLTGVMLALVPFNWQAHDTAFVTAHLHYVLVGGLVFPLLAGVYYWMPHVCGRMPSERLGKYAFWLVFLGFNVTFLPMHLTGLVGMPRRVYTYPDGLGWDMLNLVSSIGSFAMAFGFVLLIIDVVVHARIGRITPRNPWCAGTLEWAMATPPPSYNIASFPVVTSRDPVWDSPDLGNALAAGQGELSEYTEGVRETIGVDVISGQPRSIVRVPGPSYLPFFAAIATGVFFVCVLFKVYLLSLVGLVGALFFFIRWAKEAGLRTDRDFTRSVMGRTLPPHHALSGAPGEWGVALVLVADAALLAALIFGYFFLWLIAPGEPPPNWVTLGPAGWLAFGLATLAAAWAGWQGLNRRPPFVSAVLWVVALLAVSLLTYLAPTPTEHAYAAATTVLYLYVAFHLVVAAIMSVFVHWRTTQAGLAPNQFKLDLSVLRVWARFTAVVTIGVLTLIAVIPWMADRV